MSKGTESAVISLFWGGLAVLGVVALFPSLKKSLAKAAKDAGDAAGQGAAGAVTGVGQGLASGIAKGVVDLWTSAANGINDIVSGLTGIPIEDSSPADDAKPADGTKLADYQPPDFGPPTPIPSVIGTVPQPGGDTETLYSNGSYGVGGTW